MKNLYLFSVLILFSVSVFSQTPPDFQNALNNTAGIAANEIKNIVGDGAGNYYFCGKHSDELNFNGSKLPTGKGGAFFGKASSSGNILWLSQGGSENPQGDEAIDLAVDKNGDVFFCGTLRAFEPATFDGVKLPSAFGGFVAKYSSSGQFLWAHGYGSPIYAIAIDNNNTPVIHWESEIYKLNPANGDIDYSVYGMISGNRMNPGYHNIKIDSGNNIIVQAGNKVIKFDTNFNVLWSTPVTSTLAETFRISLDELGNVYGSFYALFGTVTVGTISKTNFPNGYMYKLDAATGTPQFVDLIQFGGNASKLKVIIADKAGNYYLSGDGAFNTPVVAKFDNNKVPIWSKTLSSKSKVNNLVLLGDNCLAIGGTHSGAASFDSYNLQLPAGSTSIDNSYIAALCSGTTSAVKNNFSRNEISVFPNPTNGKFRIKSDSEISEVRIHNLLGELIYHSKKPHTGAEINLSNRPKGIYLYQITDQKQHTKSGKIIID